MGTILLLGWLLGVKHALEPDHVVAVSAIAARSRSLRQACVIGICWGLGHTASLFFMCLLMVALRFRMPELVGLSFEFLVGAVIVLLGAGIVRDYLRQRLHAHTHAHEAEVHTHFHLHSQNPGHEHGHGDLRAYLLRALGVGAIHGLAGSGALMVLAASRLGSFALILPYVLVFGAGSVLGMLLVSGVVSLPFLLLTGRSELLQRRIQLAAGVLSVAFGIYVMWEVGLGLIARAA